MRNVLLSCVLILLTGLLLANQETRPSKGRFDFFPQIPQRVSRIDQQSKDASRYTFWSTGFPNAGAWNLTYEWEVGIPMMGPDSVPEGSTCLATNLYGFYSNDEDITALSAPLMIPDASYVELSFDEWFELESDYDFGWVEIWQGNAHHRIDARSGVSNGWRNTAIDITRWAGQEIRIAFRLISDDSVPALGWYLDSAAIEVLEPLPLTLDITGVNIANLPSVYLTASVRSPNGQVTDLGQSNFSVWENSVQQQNLFSVIAPDNTQTASSTDIVFVLDVTGSMGNEIESVRANMQAFMNHLQSQNMDYRIGFVVFGDIVHVYNQYSFFSDYASIMSIIQNVTLGEHGIGSGGDGPENQLEAMAEGCSFNWRPGASRVMIMLTDAEAHTADYVTSWTVNNLLAQRLLPNEVIVFPIFNVGQSSQMAQYVPIAEETNPDGTLYDIFDNFNAIIDEIGDYITSLYTVHYVSPIPSEDPMSRIVKLTVNSDNNSSEDYAFYLPGVSPIITREAALEALDFSPVPSLQPLELEVKIEDRVPPGLLTQSLMWRREGNTEWISAPLTMIKIDYYQAVLPANQVTGSWIEYYIVASDGQTTVTLPSTEPELHPFSIAILPAQPVVFANPLSSYSPGGPLSISISASSSLPRTLKLYYRPMGSLVYAETNMTANANSFSSVINANLGNLGVQFFIVATQSNQMISNFGNYDQPIFVAASAQIENPAPTDDLIFALKAWPNPASTSLRSGYLSIAFGLSRQSCVKAGLYNLKGQKVRDLADKDLAPGQHQFWWDLRDNENRKVSSGVYLYRLEAGGRSVCGKLLIVR